MIDIAQLDGFKTNQFTNDYTVHREDNQAYFLVKILLFVVTHFYAQNLTPQSIEAK